MDTSLINMAFLFVGLIMGFISGYLIDPRRVRDIKNKVREDWHIVKSIARHKDRNKNLGTIHRPSAQTLKERGTPIEATKDAMLETLKNDPYLNENIQN